VSETSKKEQEKITTLKRNEMVTIARKLPPLRISRIISAIRLRHALFLPLKRKISPSRQFVWELHFLHTIDNGITVEAHFSCCQKHQRFSTRQCCFLSP
jgi:hypothetical protein